MTIVTAIGGLASFLRDHSLISGNATVTTAYPDDEITTNQNLILIELVDSTDQNWIGNDGADGKKTSQDTYVFRVEAWGRRTNDPGGRSDQLAAASTMDLVRQALTEDPEGLLQENGMHLTRVSKVRALPQDRNHPDWFKYACHVSGHIDDTWEP